MNISYRWLNELLPTLDEAPDALAERLALLGFPVEDLEDLSAGLSDIVVARVIERGQHPDADRLALCRVDAGTGEELQVICGAPNVKTGGVYPFIPVGGVLPDGMKIRKAKIRGVHSFGMLCSARELGLGTDHNGILELSGDYEPGTSFLDALGLADVRMDVEVTANRGDLLSHLGVAREVASRPEDIQLPSIPGAPELSFELVRAEGEVTVDGVVVRNQAPELCRTILGAVVRGVKVGPSPDWLQARMRAVGLRPINNVVDATNYVLMELGQPQHAYDLAHLEGNTVLVRAATENEPIRTLDEEDRKLTPEMLVIADSVRPVNVAGIMGDEGSSVTDETTDIFLECAHFEAASIRNTKKALAIQSDAGYRFERFVDPTGQERALRRCLSLILATAGGELHPQVAQVAPRPWNQDPIALRLNRIERVLGVPFTADQVQMLLAPLGFVCGAEIDGVVAVDVPSWRGADVTREIDVIEEIARRHGFDQFPDTLGAFRPGTVPDHPLFQLEDQLRSHLAGKGYMEAQTPAFVPESEGEVRLQNPLSQEEPVLRRVLTPSLLRRVEYNLARGNRDVRLFELGTAFHGTPDGDLPSEETRLAVVATGGRAPGHWSSDSAALDIWDLKSALTDAAAVAWGGQATVVPGLAGDFPGVDGAAFHVVGADGTVLGAGGVVSPSALDLPPWAGDVIGFEITLPANPAARQAVTMAPLPPFPGSERDLALLVPEGVSAGILSTEAAQAAGKLLEGTGIFDVYEGEGVPEGHRSLAMRFRFRASDRTLTDSEVDKAIERITQRFAEEMGVHVRGGK